MSKSVDCLVEIALTLGHVSRTAIKAETDRNRWETYYFNVNENVFNGKYRYNLKDLRAKW